MDMKLTDIVIKSGWTHYVNGTELVIKKDEPFDVMRILDVPTFVLPLTIHPTNYSVLVNPYNYKAFSTTQTIDEVIEL